MMIERGYFCMTLYIDRKILYSIPLKALRVASFGLEVIVS